MNYSIPIIPMKSYFILSNDYLIQLIKSDSNLSSTPFFSLSPLKKYDLIHLDKSYHSSFLNPKDLIKPINNPSFQQFQLKSSFEASLDTILGLLTDVVAIKILNCSLSVCLEFVNKFFGTLSLSSKLTKLKFINCDIDDRFIDSLLKFGTVLKKISKLSFKSCLKLTELSLREIINSNIFESLTSLDLSYMNLDEEALCLLAYSELIKKIKKLKLLELKATTFTKGLRELLNPDQIPQLQSFHFSEDSQENDQKSFNKYGFQYISKDLKRLHFRSGNVKNQDPSSREIITWHDVKNYHYQNLRFLSLRGCELTTDFFQTLEIARFLRNIEELDFSSCFYTPTALKSLEKLLLSSHLTNLKNLNLSKSNIKDSTLTLISETIYLESLESLYLDNCKEIGNVGVNRVLFSDKIIKNMRILTLHNTNISDDVVYNLFSRLKYKKTPLEIKSLDFSNCQKLQSHCLNFIIDSPSVISINILMLRSTNMDDCALEILSQNVGNLKELTKIDLSCCSKITSEGFVEFFEKFKGKRLRHLKLRQTTIDDEGLKKLVVGSFIGSLEKLKLNGCKKITENGINVLINATEFKKLRVLSLLGVAINDSNINELNNAKSIIANLRTLNLMKCRQISTLTPIFTKLLNKSNIFSFNFDWDFFINQFPHLIDDSILESLGKSQHNFIRKINLAGMSHITSKGLLKLLGNEPWPLLESINITNSRIDGEGLRGIFQKKMHKNLKNLRILDFSNNSLIEDSNIIEIFKTQAENVPKKLHADDMIFKGLLMTNEMLENFSFVNNINIIDLSQQNLLGISNLSSNNLPSNCFKKLFLSENLIIVNVKKLILDKTNVTDEDLKNLHTANNLKVISLNGCANITTEALIFIAKNKNFSPDFDLHCLLKLDQLITDDFLAALPESPYLKNLRALDLNANGLVSEIGFEALAKSPDVAQIRKIDLSQTNITDKALKAISQGRFLGLERIDVSDCPLVTGNGIKSLISSNNFNPKFNLNALLQSNDVKMKINEEILIAIMKSLYQRSFTKVNFKGLLRAFPQQVFLELIQKCERIEEIDIKKTDFDDGILESLAESNSKATLRTLQMEDSIGLNEFEQVISIVMKKILDMNNAIDALNQEYSSKGFKEKDEEKMDLFGGFTKKMHLESFRKREQEIITGTIEIIKSELKLAQFKLLDKSYFNDFDIEYYLFSEKSSVNDLALQFLGSKLFDVLKKTFPTRMKDLKIPDPETMIATLRHMAFIGNLNITHKGIADLVSSPNIANLEILDLSNTKVNDQAIEAIGNSPYMTNLKNLFFMDSPYITAKSLDFLIKSEKNLMNLNLQPIFRLFSHWIEDSVVEVLAKSPLLEKIAILYLNKSKITNKSFEYLSVSDHSFNIKCIEISEAFLIGDSSLEMIANSIVFKELIEINMNKTPLIGAKGLVTLLKSKNLNQKLDMYKILLKQKLELLTGEALLEFLESRFWLKRVKKLSFSHAVLLSAQDFIAFLDKIQEKKHILYELNVDHTNINDEVLIKLSISSFIEKIRFLNISNCPYVSHEGISALFRSGSKADLTKLQIIYDSGIIRYSLLEDFTKKPEFLINIQKLDFSQNLYFTNKCLETLIECPSISQLRSLDISYTNVDAKGVISLVYNKNLFNLSNLQLKGLALTNESLKILCRCETFSPFFKITDIFKSLEDRRLIDNEVLNSLTTNKKVMKEIVELDLSGTDVCSSGISNLAISENVYNLETLDISNTEVDDIGVISLAKSSCLSSFKRLFFNNCVRITKISIKFLSKRQQNLDISLQDIIENTIFLTNSPSRTSASLEPMKWIFFELSTLKSIAKNKHFLSIGPDQRIKFPMNFQFKSTKEFEEILSKGAIFRNLKEISFENNSLLKEEDLWPIVTCPYLRNLRKIAIINCNISAKTLEKFVNAYKVLINLEISHLFKSNEKLINDSVLQSLNDSPYLSKIETLSLEFNKEVTSYGIKSLATSRFCFNINEINCSHSNIDDKSLEELSNSRFLLNLRRIGLKGCSNITTEGLKFLINSSCLSYRFSVDELFANLAEIHEKNILSDELLLCLSSSSKLIHLRKLRLFYTKGEISHKGLESLLSKPNVVNLRVIDLSRSIITPEIINAISNNLKFLRSLREVNLDKTTGDFQASISNLLIAMTPPYDDNIEKNQDNREKNDEKTKGYVNYVLQKKNAGLFKIIPKKFNIQKLIDQIQVNYDIFQKLIYCPLFYNVRHFIYNESHINMYLLKDLVFFQQSRNMKKIVIKATDIDENTSTIIAKSEVLRDLEQLDLPDLEIESLIPFIGTKIVHREYEPFSLFRNTILKVTNNVLKQIASWEKFLNTTTVDLSNNQLITGNGISQLLSTDYSCQIIEINLSGTNVDNIGISAICDNSKMPRLQKLRIANCPNLNAESLKIICDDTLNKLSPFFIYNIPFKDLQAKIDDSVLQKLNNSKIIQYFTELDFSNLKVSIKDLLVLISNKNLSHLKELSLLNTKIDDDFLEKISLLGHLSCLKVLKLINPGSLDSNLLITSNGISHLFSAKFSDYFDIKDFIIQIKSFINDDICLKMKSSKLLRNLIKLDLCKTKFSSEKILDILENPDLNHLIELDLSFTNLNNETLGKLSWKLGFKNVIYMNIEGCKGITATQSLIDFFNGEMINESFNFQLFFDEIIDKFDHNYVSFSNTFKIPLFNPNMQSIEQRIPLEDSNICLISKDFFFGEFLKTRFFNKKLTHISLLNYRFLDSVALKIFENPSESFDISDYLFSLPLTIQRKFIDSHIQKIVLNYNNIKYIQLKSFPSITYGFNYLLKADCATKFELAFKAQYIKKIRVQSSISADSLQKFLIDTSNYPEFFSFIRELNFSQNKYLSYLNALLDNNLSNWEEVNEEVFTAIKVILDTWTGLSPQKKTIKGKTNTIAPNSEIVSPESRSPAGSQYYKVQNFNDLKKLQYRGQKINLIDDQIQTTVLLPFIKHCTHLNKLNLKGQNIGDSFLKEFSMFLSNDINLKTLHQLNLEDNTRITAVGLKYLYTSVYKRAGKLQIFIEKEKITYKNKGKSNSPDSTWTLKPMNRLSNQGVEELSENIFKEPFLRNTILKNNGLEEIKDLESGAESPLSRQSAKDYKDLKEKSMKNLNDKGSMSPLGKNSNLNDKGGMSPNGKKDITESKFKGKNVYTTTLTTKKESIGFFEEYQLLVTTLMIYGLFETINQHFIGVWKRHYIVMIIVMVILFPFTLFHLFRLMILKLQNTIDRLLKDKKFQNSCLVKCLESGLNLLSKSIKCKCMMRKNKAPEKKLEFLKNEEQNVFYFDKDVAYLNSVLSFRSLKKDEESTYHYRPFFLKFLPYFILIDFLIYYLYIILYPTANEVGCSANDEPVKSVIFDVPYYCYAVVNLLFEALFLNEIANIMNSRNIFAMFSLSNLLSLISTQTARYDLYTDINFMILLFRCNDSYDLAIASLCIISINLFITVYLFLKTYITMYYKYRDPDDKEKNHPTFFLDHYTQLAYNMDYQGLGNILDRFSTKSATIIKSKMAPSFLRGIYFPSAMISRFQRMLIENIPLIVIQLIFMVRNGLDFTDFTQMKTFITTLISIVGSLNRVWDAKPSLFERRIFNKYYESLEENVEKEKSKDVLNAYKDKQTVRRVQDLAEISENEEEDEEKRHENEHKMIERAMRPDRKKPTLMRLNSKAVSLLIDNDEDDEVVIRPRKVADAEFKLNPILMSAKEDFNSTSSLKTSIFGGLNFQSKDSEQEDGALNGLQSPGDGDSSPDPKKYRR